MSDIEEIKSAMIGKYDASILDRKFPYYTRAMLASYNGEHFPPNRKWAKIHKTLISLIKDVFDDKTIFMFTLNEANSSDRSLGHQQMFLSNYLPDGKHLCLHIRGNRSAIAIEAVINRNLSIDRFEWSVSDQQKEITTLRELIPWLLLMKKQVDDFDYDTYARHQKYICNILLTMDELFPDMYAAIATCERDSCSIYSRLRRMIIDYIENHDRLASPNDFMRTLLARDCATNDAFNIAFLPLKIKYAAAMEGNEHCELPDLLLEDIIGIIYGDHQT